MPKPLRKPAYLLHKATGQARCRIDGKDHYLGPFGSPESRERFDDLIREWCLRNGDTSSYVLAIDELCLRFVEWAESYYRHPDGTPTGSMQPIRHALRFVIQEFGAERVRSFGPLKLKRVREAMIDAGLCRTNINRLLHWVRRVFSWGVENELVPIDVYSALKTVAPLKRGRTKARESDPVQAVAEGTVTNTIPYLPKVVADMVRLQLLTGARPGEICALRPRDVTIQTNGVWVYRLTSHKTAHRGKERRIHIGPQGQTVLRPYLDREPDAYCFVPAESEQERNAERRANRKSPMTPSQAARRPKHNRRCPPSDRYTKDSYRRAVVRACEIAFGMPTELRNIDRKLPVDEKERLQKQASEWRKRHCWAPNRLRHSRATIIREKYGIEAAQVVLGHSDPRVTEIYAARDFGMAAEIMLKIG